MMVNESRSDWIPLSRRIISTSTARLPRRRGFSESRNLPGLERRVRRALVFSTYAAVLPAGRATSYRINNCRRFQTVVLQDGATLEVAAIDEPNSTRRSEHIDITPANLHRLFGQKSLAAETCARAARSVSVAPQNRPKKRQDRRSGDLSGSAVFPCFCLASA